MITFFFIVLSASILASLLGVGGGFLLLPAIAYIQGVPFKDAVFLSLCSVFFLGALKLVGHREFIRPIIRRLLLYAGCAAAGSLTASLLFLQMKSSHLELGFNLLLIALALKLLFERKETATESSKIGRQISYPLFFASGNLAGFFGIGGGVLNVPILHKILKYPMNEAVILSFFFVFISSGIALITQFQTREEYIKEIPPALLGVLILGTFLGYKISRRIRLPNPWLKTLFAILILGVGLTRLLV